MKNSKIEWDIQFKATNDTNIVDDLVNDTRTSITNYMNELCAELNRVVNGGVVSTDLNDTYIIFILRLIFNIYIFCVKSIYSDSDTSVIPFKQKRRIDGGKRNTNKFNQMRGKHKMFGGELSDDEFDHFEVVQGVKEEDIFVAIRGYTDYSSADLINLDEWCVFIDCDFGEGDDSGDSDYLDDEDDDDDGEEEDDDDDDAEEPVANMGDVSKMIVRITNTNGLNGFLVNNDGISCIGTLLRFKPAIDKTCTLRLTPLLPFRQFGESSIVINYGDFNIGSENDLIFVIQRIGGIEGHPNIKTLGDAFTIIGGNSGRICI